MIWKTIKQSLPVAIGILIGAGLTRNKYVGYTLGIYFVVMIIANLFKDKVLKIKDSVDKKEAIKEQIWETLESTEQATAKGHAIGANAFDRYYKMYSFYFSLALFITFIILLLFSQWFAAVVTLITMNVFIVINQMQRGIREIKEYLADVELYIEKKKELARKL